MITLPLQGVKFTSDIYDEFPCNTLGTPVNHRIATFFRDSCRHSVRLAWPYTQPVWVFTSRDLPTVPGADIRFVSGNIRPVHTAMAEAAAGKNLWMMGGGELAGQFHDEGLLDEFIIGIASATLGVDASFFPRRIANPPLKLLFARTFGTDFALLTDAVGG